ncbi:hypothetical protein IMZ48_04660 [Candidatus Bathyarchaeota archaeon]|nr:hypothetical protein [Candidatus Bathyarchaeota archaeon]
MLWPAESSRRRSAPFPFNRHPQPHLLCNAAAIVAPTRSAICFLSHHGRFWHFFLRCPSSALFCARRVFSPRGVRATGQSVGRVASLDFLSLETPRDLASGFRPLTSTPPATTDIVLRWQRR